MKRISTERGSLVNKVNQASTATLKGRRQTDTSLYGQSAGSKTSLRYNNYDSSQAIMNRSRSTIAHQLQHVESVQKLEYQNSNLLNDGASGQIKVDSA